MPIILDDSVLEGAQSTGKDAIDTTDAAITTLSDAKAITPKYFSKVTQRERSRTLKVVSPAP